MKKSLLSLVGVVALSAVVWWFASAQLDVSDLFSEGLPLVDDAYTKLLNDYDDTRWYLDATVTCEVNNGVTITSPIIEDSTIEDATTYNLFLSPYRVDQLKAWDSSINTSKIVMKKVEIGSNSDNIKFEVSSSDVDPDVEYYGFISPIDVFDYVGTPSKEICFKMSNNVCLVDTACNTLSNIVESQNTEEIENHGSASDCVWMKMANVTHSVKGDVATLKWTAIEGDKVEIAIMDPETEVYKSLWTVKMSDEKFEYKMQWDWEQNFTLTNGCEWVNHKFEAKRWEASEISVTPATGPAENILYIAIAAIILYWAYTVFFRKSDNN